MKNGKHFFLGTFVAAGFLLGTGLVIAQSPITISWPVPTPFGKTINVAIDTSVNVSSLNLGVTGGPQAWNFAEDVSQWPLTIETKEVSETPYADAFPTAEWVDYFWQYVPATTILGITLLPDTLIEVYNYKRLEGGWIKGLGIGMDHPLMKGTPFVYSPPSTVYPNPLTTNSGQWTEYAEFNPKLFGTIGGTVTDSSIVTVDAWGELTVSTGKYPCLRVKRKEFRHINFPGYYDETIQTYTYIFLTQNFDPVLSVTGSQSKGEDFTEADYAILATNLTGCDPGCRSNKTLPKSWKLGQNYPNPFNPTTTISYALPEAAKVELKIFNIMGQQVTVLEAGTKTAGEHTIIWSGKDIKGREVPPGIYFYQLKATSLAQGKTFIQTKKMLMTK